MTMTKQAAALSHAQAYLQEIGPTYNTNAITADIYSATTIRQLVAVVKKYNIRAPHYDKRTTADRITTFYRAMMKVVPHLDYPEHGGTECRGWYRVHEAIVNPENRYYSSGDCGRDTSMAYDLVIHGAVTKPDYNRWLVKQTLYQLMDSCNANPDGLPNITAIKNRWNKEWRHIALHTNLIDTISNWAEEEKIMAAMVP